MAVSMCRRLKGEKNIIYRDHGLPAEMILTGNCSGKPRVLYKVRNDSKQVCFHKQHTAFNYGQINVNYCKVMLQDISMCQRQVKTKICIPLRDYGLFPSFRDNSLPSLSPNALCGCLYHKKEQGKVHWRVEHTFGGAKMHPQCGLEHYHPHGVGCWCVSCLLLVQDVVNSRRRVRRSLEHLKLLDLEMFRL